MLRAVWCAGLLQCACAGAPDHFYTLNTLPAGGRTAPSAPTIHVHLDVTVPSVVDRSEMVLNSAPNGITLFEHERWAAPLAVQVAQTLASDLEQRRGDILVGDGRFDQSASPPVSIEVDIVQMSAQRSGAATIEAHCRIIDTAAGLDQLAVVSLRAPISGAGFAAVAGAYSQALSELADKLAADVPRRQP